jgi:hypothetical protein
MKTKLASNFSFDCFGQFGRGQHTLAFTTNKFTDWGKKKQSVLSDAWFFFYKGEIFFIF